MDIHICREVGAGKFRQSLEDAIKNSGHMVVSDFNSASYIIGFSNSDFGPVKDSQKIVLREGRHFEPPIHPKSKGLHPANLRILSTNRSLSEWITEREEELLSAM